jgi:hypothetical protein
MIYDVHTSVVHALCNRMFGSNGVDKLPAVTARMLVFLQETSLREQITGCKPLISPT